jgi:hypothetical protein
MTELSDQPSSGDDCDSDCDDGILPLPPGDRSLAGGTHEDRDFMFAEAERPE